MKNIQRFQEYRLIKGEEKLCNIVSILKVSFSKDKQVAYCNVSEIVTPIN